MLTIAILVLHVTVTFPVSANEAPTRQVQTQQATTNVFLRPLPNHVLISPAGSCATRIL